MKNDKTIQALQENSIQDEATALISKAIDKNVPVETMEKLLAMRRELKAEKAKEKYDKAMAEFQAECPLIEKTKIVYEKDKTTERYRYAPIESIILQVKDLLKKHGFSYNIYTKQTANMPNMMGVVCKVTHEAGHTQDNEPFFIPIGSESYMSEVQKYGARLTFAKRYAFCGAFGILTGDEDNDAQTVGIINKSYKGDNGFIHEKTDEVIDLSCHKCNAKAEQKAGISKTGKPCTAIFCSTGIREHTRFVYTKQF